MENEHTITLDNLNSVPEDCDNIHEPGQIVTSAANRKKRTIRPRVLKSDYDWLKDKYDIVRLLAIIGWSLAVCAIGVMMLILFL